jgi:hypothetical protein
VYGYDWLPAASMPLLLLLLLLPIALLLLLLPKTGTPTAVTVVAPGCVAVVMSDVWLLAAASAGKYPVSPAAAGGTTQIRVVQQRMRVVSRHCSQLQG